MSSSQQCKSTQRSVKLFEIIDIAGRTVELVQSIVQAAKYVSLAPPKDKCTSIATQTEVQEPEADKGKLPPAVVTVDKSTETTEEYPAQTTTEPEKEEVAEIKEESGSGKPEIEEEEVEEKVMPRSRSI